MVPISSVTIGGTSDLQKANSHGHIGLEARTDVHLRAGEARMEGAASCRQGHRDEASRRLVRIISHESVIDRLRVVGILANAPWRAERRRPDGRCRRVAPSGGPHGLTLQQKPAYYLGLPS